MKVIGFLLAFAAGVSLASSSQAQPSPPSPFGKDIEKWTFTRQKETRGTICRAFRKVGGRDDVMAMRTDGDSYLSVRADGRKAKYQDSFVKPFREPDTGIQWDMTAEANGERMWFVVPPNGIEMIAGRGGYAYYLGGTEDNGKVDLGKSAGAAWKRVRECVVASGG